jgi:hypothetical protein
MNDFIWEKFNNPKLLELKKLCKLDTIILDSDDEFKQQLSLKNWVFNQLPLGNPSRDYSSLSSFEILEDRKKGHSFYCTQYSQLFIQTSIALNWYSRKLSIDTDHSKNEKSMHHGICDIWSSKYKKWYVVDPMNNLHYEKDGIPLNSLEIRQNYINNFAENIFGIVSNKQVKYNKDSKGFKTPSNYFWFFVSQRNNFFEKPGIFDTKAYLWVDEYNKDKIWYKDNQQHPMYKDRFEITDNQNLVFPEIL